MSLHLILGGARSGKSRYAEQLAHDSGLPVTVVVTAQALDDEMRARIAHHQAERPQHWQTVEAPLELAPLLRVHASSQSMLIVDCLTLWLTNLMLRLDQSDGAHRIKQLHKALDELLETLDRLSVLGAHVVLVANEIGLGLVPQTPLGRLFRDEAGRLNQQIAARCERVTFIAAGLPLSLK